MSTSALALILAACGASARPIATTIGRPCPNGCRPAGSGGDLVARGAAALAAFQPEEALPLLEQAKAAGPYPHDVLVRLWEQLGIAYAYLDREADALAAFDHLLALDPDHLLSYELAPKVTLKFERARAQARAVSAPPELDLDWPRELDVSRPVPIDVEVVSDPKAFLVQASLHFRREGTKGWEATDVELPKAGSRKRVVLPALGGEKAEALDLWVTGLDRKGNEVLVWADPERPRRISLSYRPPERWYQKWWVWTIGGTVAVGVVGASVYFLSQGPPETIDGSFTAR